jgi:hypothetical protein
MQQGSVCVALGLDASTADGGVQTGGEAGEGEGGVVSNVPPTFGGVTALAPASPTALLAVWNAGTDPTTPGAPLRYNVYVGPSTAGLAYTDPLMTGVNALSLVIPNLTTGTEYSVGVRAVNGSGAEDKNMVVLKGTPGPDTMGPTFKGLVSATPGGSGAVKLSWAAATDDKTPTEAITYLVYDSETSIDSEGGQAEDFSNPVLVTAPGATTATVRRLGDPTLTRYFIVRARDAAGNTDSNVVEKPSLPGPDTVPPVFKGCVAATQVQALTIADSWVPATDDVSDPANITYDVYSSTTSGKYDFTTPFAVVKGQSEAVITGLQPSTQYYFVCRAKDEAGNEDQNTVEVTAKTGKNPIPPTFTGIATLTPDAIHRTAALTWNAGTDNSMSGLPLVYDLYIATTSMGENYNQPPFATSAGGATMMTVTDLPSNSNLFMVLRARDGDGNHDTSNPPVEKSMMTDVSFALDIQTIFANDCGVVGCHVPGSPTGGLILAPGFAYNQIVNVPALEGSKVPFDGGVGVNYVTPYDPSDSFLNMKVNASLYSYVTGAPPNGLGQKIGVQMPAPSTGSSLSPTELNNIALWIAQGANNN